MKTIYKVFLLLLLIFSGCTEDKFTPESGNNKITLKLTDTQDVEARSIASTNERFISDAYLLVFRDGYYFAGEKVNVAANIANNGGQTPTITFGIRIAAGDKVIVLCNTGVASMPAFSVGVNTEADVNARFPSAGWNINQVGTDSGRGMPMSGTIDSWTNTATCHMKRAVAKIEVAVHVDITGDVSWQVYNHVQQGNILGPASGLSVPSAPSFTNDPTPRKATESTFYMPEFNNSERAKNATVSNTEFNADRTCVMLKTPAGYYRLDLYDQVSKTYMDIRRNHHYTVNITTVRSNGYATLAEALANPPSNVEYSITVTDENTNVVVSNGQYAIGMSADTVYIYGGMRTYDIARVRKINAPATVTTNSISFSTGYSMGAATGLVTSTTLSDNMETIRLNLPGGDFKGTVTLKLGNLTKTIAVVKQQYQYKKKIIFACASSSNYGYNIGIAVSGVNKVLSAAVNFGENGTISTEQPEFYQRTSYSAGASSPNLYPAIDAKVDIIVLSQDVYLDAVQSKRLADYVKAGGVLIYFNEGNGYTGSPHLADGTTSNFMRAMFGKSDITSRAINYAGDNYGSGSTMVQGGTGVLYGLSSYDDDVLNGPFGDVRGLQWGEDASWARGIANLPQDQIVIYSTGITKSYPAAYQNPAYANYVTAFRHKTYNLIYFGDGGFTSGGTYSSERNSMTICPFNWDDATFKPLPKYYGGPGAKMNVYNSALFCNIMAWAIERATNNGINTPR